jgi:hypothetical protein
MTAFVKTIIVTPYTYQKSPTMNGSDKIFQDRTAREMTDKLNQITSAVIEIQAYLATLP